MPITKGTRQVAENRRARHDYFIEDTYECGIALVGTEVKSVRAGKVNLKDSYAQVKNGEMLLVGMHISPYDQGNIFNKDPSARESCCYTSGRYESSIPFPKRMDTALSPPAFIYATGW